MKKMFVMLFLIAILPTTLFAQDFTLKTIRFFEGGYNVPEESQRKFTVQFPKSTTRYVWCQIDVENRLYNVREQNHKVIWRFYNADGTLRGEMNADFRIKPEWSTAWIPHGWGADQQGNWPVGTYRAEVLIDGIKVAQDYFTIYDDVAIKTTPVSPGVDDKLYLRYKSVKFFEGAFDPAPREQRQYKNQFPKSTTRYVYYQVLAQNLLYRDRSHRPVIIARYYKPDGTLMGEPKLSTMDVLTDWDDAELWHGWGWKEPGNWTPGTYRVEILFGNTKVADERFTIYDDVASTTPPVTSGEKTYLEFEFVKFFEGSFAAPPESQREFKTQFSKSATRYVFFQVGAKNLLYKNRVHKPIVVGRYYNPDGSFRGEGKVNVDIPPDWEKADLWGGWGWEKSGNWPVGTYRVEIWFANTKVGQGSFSIYDDRASTSPPVTSIPAETVYLEFRSVKFFEGSTNASPPESQSQYKADFPRSTTRYLYFLVNAKNLLYRNRNHKPLIFGRYYYPDGTLFGEMKIDNVEVLTGWENAEFWTAWGWDEPGKWTLGAYRVEILFGNTKVGEGRFTVYDDRK